MNLEDLIKIIDARATADPSESWTAKLLSQGPEKCAEKFGEESVELIIEAVKGRRDAKYWDPQCRRYMEKNKKGVKKQKKG